jgi:hypothetical protein
MEVLTGMGGWIRRPTVVADDPGTVKLTDRAIAVVAAPDEPRRQAEAAGRVIVEAANSSRPRIVPWPSSPAVSWADDPSPLGWADGRPRGPGRAALVDAG